MKGNNHIDVDALSNFERGYFNALLFFGECDSYDISNIHPDDIAEGINRCREFTKCFPQYNDDYSRGIDFAVGVHGYDIGFDNDQKAEQLVNDMQTDKTAIVSEDIQNVTWVFIQ